MDSTLVSQSTIQPVQFALSEVAANLAAHANASLSKAHGFNMLVFDPGTMHDADGNDISVYYDDHGDVIGSNFIVFTLSDGVYYAPANNTTLTGQPLNTGQSGSTVAVAAPTPKRTSWITDIITPAVSTVDSVNNSILLAHTMLAYWETHSTVTVFAKTVTDSLGHLIADHVVQLTFGGSVYLIPCTTRLGGMKQAPFSLNLTQSPTKGFTQTSDGTFQVYVAMFDDVPFGNIYPTGFTVTAVAGGTAPITYAWYYYPVAGLNANPTVPDFADPAWTAWPASGVSVSLFSGHYAAYKFGWVVAANTFKITKLFPPDDSGLITLFVKVVATNAVGSTTALLRVVSSGDYADP